MNQEYIKKFLKRLFPTRKIPNDYFRGYRRLSSFKSKIEPGKCWCCKHAVAFVSWHCELDSCRWEPCYSKENLNWRDYLAGEKDVGGWLSLPGDNN